MGRVSYNRGPAVQQGAMQQLCTGELHNREMCNGKGAAQGKSHAMRNHAMGSCASGSRATGTELCNGEPCNRELYNGEGAVQ